MKFRTRHSWIWYMSPIGWKSREILSSRNGQAGYVVGVANGLETSEGVSREIKISLLRVLEAMNALGQEPLTTEALRA